MKLVRVLSVLMLIGAFAGCGEQSDKDKAKENIDKAADKVKEGADKTADKAKELIGNEKK